MSHPVGPVPVQAPQRVQNSNSTMGISPSKTVTATLPSTASTVLNVSQLTSTTSLPATVGKAYSTTTASVGDLGKILGITRGFTPQQLLLLKQQTSLHQHQQALATATPTQHVQAISAQTQAAIVQQKLSLPSGIEQLRATVASAASALPRFTGMTTNSGSTVKGLTGGRTRHVEEVLKQQSLRMATKAAITHGGGGGATIVQIPSTKVQELEKLVTKSGVIGSGDKGQVKTGTQLAKPDKV